MGDGSGSNNLRDYQVTVQNNVDDYIIGTKTWTYTYPNATNNGAPYYVNYASCCRLSTLKNGKGERDMSSLARICLADPAP